MGWGKGGNRQPTTTQQSIGWGWGVGASERRLNQQAIYNHRRSKEITTTRVHHPRQGRGSPAHAPRKKETRMTKQKGYTYSIYPEHHTRCANGVSFATFSLCQLFIHPLSRRARINPHCEILVYAHVDSISSPTFRGGQLIYELLWGC